MSANSIKIIDSNDDNFSNHNYDGCKNNDSRSDISIRMLLLFSGSDDNMENNSRIHWKFVHG